MIKSEKGEWLMFYHAWPHNAIGSKRLMLLDSFTFVSGWPHIKQGYPS